MSDEQPEPEEAETKAADADAAPSVTDAADAAKKRKKKKAADAADGAVTDPRAVAIAAAFDAGNFARVRELGQDLIKSDDAALAAIGRDYLTRIAVDPIQLAFLGLCAMALLTIAWIYIPH